MFLSYDDLLRVVSILRKEGKIADFRKVKQVLFINGANGRIISVLISVPLDFVRGHCPHEHVLYDKFVRNVFRSISVIVIHTPCLGRSFRG